MRLLILPILAACLCSPARAAEPAPEGWNTRVVELQGGARRPYHLALLRHGESRDVTLLVAPCAHAGREADGREGVHVERSASGDLQQIALWATRLHAEAKGWRRPSLRERPAASSHVVGVVATVGGAVRVRNAEHGGGALAVGDFLLAEDVLEVPKGGMLGFELMGGEDAWQHRALTARLLLGGGARLGLRGTHAAPVLHLQAGDLGGSFHAAGIRLHTPHGVLLPERASDLLVTTTNPARLDVRAGVVAVEEGEGSTRFEAGTAREVLGRARARIGLLDESHWGKRSPREPVCGRDEARALAARLTGAWHGQPRNTRITLMDDGQWRSYERQPGRSLNRAGTWEPRPGGLAELLHVVTLRRSREQRTDRYAWFLDGDALVRLRPGGPVLLPVPPARR